MNRTVPAVLVPAAVALGVAAEWTVFYRGPLVHAVLSYPTGRLRGRVERLVAAISYVAAAIPDVGENAEATAVVAALVALAAGWSFARATGPQRQARGAGGPPGVGGFGGPF